MSKKSSDDWPKEPFIGWERSRHQVMCRSGRSGPGTTVAIKFEGNGGADGAWAKAKKWLAVEKQKYEKHLKAKGKQ